MRLVAILREREERVDGCVFDVEADHRPVTFGYAVEHALDARDAFEDAAVSGFNGDPRRVLREQVGDLVRPRRCDQLHVGGLYLLDGVDVLEAGYPLLEICERPITHCVPSRCSASSLPEAS